MANLRIFLLMLFCSGVAFNCEAQLAWEKSQYTVKASDQQKAIQVAFKFTNASHSTIKITQIVPSCSCTTANLRKRSYLPGEKGIITVTYQIGDQTGLQAKRLLVITDEPQKDPYVLFLYAEIPEWLKLSDTYMVWRIGAKPSPQTIDLSAAATEPIHILSVTSDSQNMDAVLKVLTAGTQYQLTLTPKNTDMQTRATISIETDKQKDNKNRILYVYADVRADVQPQ